MSLRSSFVSAATFLIGFIIFSIASVKSDEDKVQMLKRTVEGYELEFLQNSATLSQALAVNAGGAFIGFREVPNEDLTIFRQVYFYFGRSGSKDVTVPKGYTNIELSAISDTHAVVGRCTRPVGHEDGSLRGIVWNTQKNVVELLPRPEGDLAADAQDISADGNLITGYATGPERLRPVVWTKDSKTEKWSVTVLPTTLQLNPYLMSAQLITSPDGKIVVGCCTDKFLPDGTIDSALYSWKLEDGKWEQRKVHDEQIYVKGVNNKGEIVGSLLGRQGRVPCLVTSDDKLKTLDLLEGDISGEARDINNHSVIVGFSDDPHGTEGGMVPCVWTLEGKATKLQFGGEDFGVAYGINDAGQIVGAGEIEWKQDAKKGDVSQEDSGAMLAVRATKTAVKN